MWRFWIYLIIAGSLGYCYYSLSQDDSKLTIETLNYVISMNLANAFLITCILFSTLSLLLFSFGALMSLPTSIKALFQKKKYNTTLSNLTSFIIHLSSQNFDQLPKLARNISGSAALFSKQDLNIITAIADQSKTYEIIKELSLMGLDKKQEFWYLVNCAEHLLKMRNITNVAEIADKAFALYKTPYSADLKIRALESANEFEQLVNFVNSFSARSLIGKTKKQTIIDSYAPHN